MTIIDACPIDWALTLQGRMQGRLAGRLFRGLCVASLFAGCTTDFDRFKATSQTDNASSVQAGSQSGALGPGAAGFPSNSGVGGSPGGMMGSGEGIGGMPAQVPRPSDAGEGGSATAGNGGSDVDASMNAIGDPCLTNNGGCGDPARWTCSEAGGVATCSDVAECATDNGGCGDPAYWNCIEQMGQAPTCRDIDECSIDNGGCGEVAEFACENREGAAPSCAPLGACVNDNGGCGDPDFYRCFDDGSGQPSCQDIDECATNNGGCGDARYFGCTNNTGAPPTCRDIDECATDNGGCGDARYWDCIDNTGAAPTCIDIDECASNNGGCGNALYWRCTDRDGTDPQCSDIDSCQILNGGCGNDQCVDNIGGPPTCIPRQVCGNGVVEGTEECDFAAADASPYNCSRLCRRQSLYIPCDETASSHPECLDGTICLYNLCTRPCEGISDCDFVSEVPDLQIQCPQPLGTTCVIRCSGNADCPPGASCNGGGVCIGMP